VRSSGLEPQAMERPARILLVEDDPDVRTSLRQHLAAHGYQVIAIGNGDQPEVVLSSGVDLLVSDVGACSPESLAFLRAARAGHPGLAILATAAASNPEAAILAGADDVQPKPLDLAKVTVSVGKMLELKRLRREAQAEETEPGPAGTGASPEPNREVLTLHALPGGEPSSPLDPLRDPQTGTFGAAFFLEYAALELRRSQRYGRPFGLTTLKLGEADRLQRELGVATMRGLFRAIVGAATRTARDVDLVARLHEDEVGLLLPETDHFGALMFQRRLLMAVADDPEVKAIHARHPFSLEAGAATHAKDGKTVEELLSRSRQRALQGRRSIARGLEALGFWESIEELLEGRHLGGGAADPVDPASRGLTMKQEVFQSIRAEVMREIAREPEGRGLLFLSAGTDALQASLPMLEALSGRSSSWTIHLLGRRGPSALHHPAVTPVYVDAQDPVARHDLLLFLSERTAYGLVRRAGAQGRAFHSSDAPLISHLVTRLHQAYDLHSF